MSTTSHAIQTFRSIQHQIRSLEEAIELMAWDLRTGAPRDAAPARSATIGALSEMAFRLGTSSDLEDAMEAIEELPEDQVDDVTARMVFEAKRTLERSRQIPPKRYRQYVELTSRAESIWEEAKETRNFTLLQPELEQMVQMLKEFIPLWDVNGLAASHPYNVLLDAYEPGFTVAELDRFFDLLQSEIVPLVQQIQQKGLPEQAWMGIPVSKSLQQQVNQFALLAIGFDFDRGRLDESEHPFAVGLHNTDVRITTKYIEEDLMNALYSTLHECGHAMYEQQIDDRFMGTNLATGTSMGIHESQSRFWENVIGRSVAFWDWFYPHLQRLVPEPFATIDQADFYKALHRVEPSLIRIDADELTYSLHVLIRYRLEKALFGGTLAVRDLPAAWDAAYEEVLGVRPPHDGQGVLQDVHWSGGAFGYFPSYALGNVYAAQLLERLNQDVPTWQEEVSKGQFGAIRNWLREQVHQYGKSIDPKPLMEQVTGKAFDPEAYVRYLKDKYSLIYRLNEN